MQEFTTIKTKEGHLVDVFAGVDPTEAQRLADILGYSIDYITPENLAEVREMAERVGAQAVALPVTIAYYNHAGAKLGEQDCTSAAHAFGELTRLGLDAHAYPTGTTRGLYNWQRHHTHTLAAFVAKMREIKSAN